MTLLTIGITGCRTVEYVAVTPSIPTFDEVRPTRPYLPSPIDEESIKTGYIRLMTYARQLEAYADGIDTYLEGLNNL